MKTAINWSKAGQYEREAVVRLCGWETRKGNASSVGKRIANTAWENILPNTRSILERAGILP